MLLDSMYEQLLHLATQVSEWRCSGIAACGPYVDWLITIGIVLAGGAAALIMLRRIRKPMPIAK